MILPPELTIDTPRCRLRRPSRDDFPHIFSATRHEGFNDGMVWDAPATEAELIPGFEKGLQAREEGTAYGFAVELREPNVFVGHISIRQTKEAEVWSIGFWTHPEQQGKGIMSEVVPAVLALGFRELGARRIEACHALWNHASRRVLEKSGMRFVRFVPQGFQKRGQWVEENLYAISREEWEK